MAAVLKVMHLITGLGTGGAEANLSKLVRSMDRTRFQNTVVSIMPIGAMGTEIAASGIPVESLNVTRGTPDPLALFKLSRILRQSKPDILQTWMYHADLLGGITARFLTRTPVIWNIRHGALQRSNGVMTYLVAKLCAALSSHIPAKIVCCSNASAKFHTEFGYDPTRMAVIFNGYDCNHLRPDPKATESVKAELGISEDSIIIANVGRFHPQKDHHTFLLAAQRVKAKIKNAQFVLCGEEVTWQNTALSDQVTGLGLKECIHLLGRRKDISRIMAAAMVLASSSCAEGFPNVIAEAMACGTICVVTDVGDAAYIVGDTGIVVPPRNPTELAEGIIRACLHTGTRLNGSLSRERILSLFTLNVSIERYEQLYESATACYDLRP